jgi:chromosome segregation protein
MIAADRSLPGRPAAPDEWDGAREIAARLSVPYALDLVKAPAELAGAVEAVLAGILVAEDLRQGLDLVREDPQLRVVTRDGDLIGAHWARGGSAGAPSLLGLRAAQDEAGRLSAAIASAERAREKDLAQLSDLQGRLAACEAEAPDGPGAGAEDRAEGPADRGPVDKNTLAAAAVAARNAEMEARLQVRTLEERLRAVAGRGDALAAAAAAERQAIQRARERSERRAREAAVAEAVASGATIALAAIERSRAMADAERQAAERDSHGRDEKLKAVRARIRELTAELETAVSTAHGAEMERAARRMKLEQVAVRATEEFAIEPDALLAEYGPDVEIPGADEGQMPAPYDRAVQDKRAASAQRLLDQLGKVNPLALEEFSALEERHAFLSTQLEDLKKTRRDLLIVIKEVDDRVQEVFASAYEDTAREFEDIIGRLFPGGDGRLILTEPDDLLVTGIEIECRPPGKKVKRLSLLSGGERALTAIAFVVAIFKARPSPFYVLDEVEAALDDANLQRLLQIFAELRDASQLIIVTHQQRTMEVADTLYGISMRGDGVSAVVSQRLREPESA